MLSLHIGTPHIFQHLLHAAFLFCFCMPKQPQVIESLKVLPANDPNTFLFIHNLTGQFLKKPNGDQKRISVPISHKKMSGIARNRLLTGKTVNIECIPPITAGCIQKRIKDMIDMIHLVFPSFSTYPDGSHSKNPPILLYYFGTKGSFWGTLVVQLCGSIPLPIDSQKNNCQRTAC